jgi:pyruvate ferredoxin oxidoreductase alpha subunit
MPVRERLSGNEAVAFAMKQINPDVMGAFPITPSTEIPQYFSQYVANGEVDTEFVAESRNTAPCPPASGPRRPAAGLSPRPLPAVWP